MQRLCRYEAEIILSSCAKFGPQASPPCQPENGGMAVLPSLATMLVVKELKQACLSWEGMAGAQTLHAWSGRAEEGFLQTCMPSHALLTFG